MDYTSLQKAINDVVPLPEDDLALLSTYATRRQLKKGQVLLKDGDICRCFYFVESGHLRTWYNKDGQPINLNFTFEGAFTANIKSLLRGLPSHLILEAGEDSVVWIINLEYFPEQKVLRPQLSQFVRRVAFGIMLAAESHSDLFKFYKPVERYQYIEKNNPQLLQRISLSQMASYLGVTRETLSRIRARTS